MPTPANWRSAERRLRILRGASQLAQQRHILLELKGRRIGALQRGPCRHRLRMSRGASVWIGVTSNRSVTGGFTQPKPGCGRRPKASQPCTVFRCDRAPYADLTVTFAILSKTLTARLLKLCTSGSASAERGGRMQSKGNQRRWLLWIVLLATAAASAEASAQQDQAQQQMQQQQQQQQQQQSSANPDAPKGLSAAYLDCRKQASGVYDQQRCIERERRAQEDRMARAYDTLRYRLSGSDRAKLMDAQYTWQQSDAQAGDLDKALGGGAQAAALQRAEAALERINARANELEKYARR
ncbi:lysozyme inhibitor LprI family protein [Xanthomonas translucens pv. translucens]|uniref:lysozyme inhibitor LprI family protein n=1 Tax=Xanthomonas campestris pv. translucens TaxID=343 RepID=UPI003F6EE0D9